MTEEQFRARIACPRPAPYNTGKVLIGVAYVPRQRWMPSRDAYAIQTALLEAHRPRQTLLQRLWSYLA